IELSFSVIAHLNARTNYIDSNSPCTIYALSSILLLPWIADLSIWCKRYRKIELLHVQRDTVQAIVSSNKRKVDGRLLYDVNGRISTRTAH
ncbi:hypothetical protein K450DRAFT_255268, partial [Umbelopsis ramanniana AG]